MDTKKPKKNISSLKIDKGKTLSDYKLLVHKLKGIKEIVNLLEKKFLQKEI